MIAYRNEQREYLQFHKERGQCLSLLQKLFWAKPFLLFQIIEPQYTPIIWKFHFILLPSNLKDANGQ